jgi:hypothetical protein
VGTVHRIRTALPATGERSASWAVADWELLVYLREICELLWPPPATITLEKGRRHWLRSPAVAPWTKEPADAGGTGFVLVPGIRRPRLLVPAAPRVASAALRHYGTPGTRAARLAAKALSFGLAGGLGGSVVGATVRVTAPPEGDTIEAYLRTVISSDVQVSVHVGAPRANRKPVLQLLTPSGMTVGFAKIGVNPLTRELVRTEHDSLARLGQLKLAEITVPRILHYGDWHGLNVLVLSTLPTWLRRRPVPTARLVAAMDEVAQIEGVRQEPFLNSAHLKQLGERLAVSDDGPERTALLQVLDGLASQAGNAVLSYGAWHGDWTQWNMANTDRGLLLWDWERFTCGVPLGFDALHHWLHAEVGLSRRDPLAAATDCARNAPQIVAPFGVTAREARLTALLYLTDLATRYLVDRQAEAGAPRGAPGTWLIPAITGELARL